MLEVEDAGELGDRVVVLVDAEIDPDVVAGAVAGASADDQEGSRLAAAPVAAGRVRRREARDEQLRKRPTAREGCVDETVDDRRAGEDVALRRVPGPRPASGPREARRSGVARRAAVGIDD